MSHGGPNWRTADLVSAGSVAGTHSAGACRHPTASGVAVAVPGASNGSWRYLVASQLELGGVARPWLVYGANVYSASRLQQIVQRWPSQWIDGPLLVSEFAPGGAGADQRPAG